MMRTLFLFRVPGMAYWLNRMAGFIACLWLASFLFLSLFTAYCFELYISFSFPMWILLGGLAVLL